MEFVRTNKYRLYPNATQKSMLHNMFGMYRFAFNHTLGLIQESHFGTYEVKNGKNKGKIVPRIPSQTEICGFSTELKAIKPFMSKLPNDFIQASLANLYKGTKGFYRGGGFPKFKSRKAFNQSINFYAGSRAKIEDDVVILARAKDTPFSKEDHRFKFKKHKTNHALPSKITGYTISKDNLGLYWIAITFKVDISPKLNIRNSSVGIDLGIKDMLIDSNGEKVPNHNLTKRYSKKLSKEQRRLSRKKKGSKNRSKQRIKVAKVHKKISNTRNHINHVVSKTYIDLYDFIALESLQVKNMVKNRRLSKAISNIAWFDLISKFKYKMAEKQGQVVQINQWYPSSKTCNRCGCVKASMPLNIRIYKCLECGNEEDRDINAAKNILAVGLRDTKPA